jgi:hypothetical protein
MVVLSLIATVLFVDPSAFKARATDVPHVIISNDVWLLNDQAEKLFMLPVGYYAEIVGIEGGYYKVIFNGINGMILKNSVSAVGYHTIASGTILTLRINDEYHEFESIKLQRTPDALSESVISMPITATFTFLGEYPTETSGVWYYVNYNQSYGYIKSTRTNISVMKYEPFIPESKTDNMAPTTVEESMPDDDTEPLERNVIKVAIVIGMIVPIMFIVLLIFKTGKTRKYYDE